MRHAIYKTEEERRAATKRSQAKYCEKNKDLINARQKKWVKENPEKVKASYEKHRRESLTYLPKIRLRYKNLRLEVLKFYGGDPCHCFCCGEKEVQFLCIDHVNGGGNEHRKQKGVGFGSTFYFWLKRNNFPMGFRVLCYNCNMARGFYGRCPHQDK